MPKVDMKALNMIENLCAVFPPGLLHEYCYDLTQSK